MTMQQKIEAATRVVSMLQRGGHEVLDVRLNLFELRPVIEVAPLPQCTQLNGHPTNESFGRPAAGYRPMMTTVLGDCCVEWVRQ